MLNSNIIVFDYSAFTVALILCIKRIVFTIVLGDSFVCSGRNTNAQLLLGSQFLPLLVVLAAAFLGVGFFGYVCG